MGRGVTLEEARQYDPERLRALIKKREKNIAVFEQAIAKEREAMQREQVMISLLENE